MKQKLALVIEGQLITPNELMLLKDQIGGLTNVITTLMQWLDYVVLEQHQGL